MVGAEADRRGAPHPGQSVLIGSDCTRSRSDKIGPARLRDRGWHMRRTRSTLTSLVLCAFALPSPAEELAELLMPVDPAVEAQLMAKSNFDFRQDRYFAYRFRVVDINWKLLDEKGARFTITPFTEPVFAELAVTVQTKTLDRDTIPDDLTTNWVGEIVDSAWLRQGGSNFAPVSIWITTGLQEVTLKAARKIAAETGDTTPYAMLPAPSKQLVTSKLNLRTLSASWIVSPGVELILQPIPDDPRYHFVYLVDIEKVPASSHGDGGPDEIRKLRALDEFNEQLDKERHEAASAEQ